LQGVKDIWPVKNPHCINPIDFSPEDVMIEDLRGKWLTQIHMERWRKEVVVMVTLLMVVVVVVSSDELIV